MANLLEGGREIRDSQGAGESLVLTELSPSPCTNTRGRSPHSHQGIFSTWKFLPLKGAEPKHPPSFELRVQLPGKHQNEIKGWLCSGQAQCKCQPIPCRTQGRAEQGWGEGSDLPEVALQSATEPGMDQGFLLCPNVTLRFFWPPLVLSTSPPTQAGLCHPLLRNLLLSTLSPFGVCLLQLLVPFWVQVPGCQGLLQLGSCTWVLLKVPWFHLCMPKYSLASLIHPTLPTWVSKSCGSTVGIPKYIPKGAMSPKASWDAGAAKLTWLWLSDAWSQGDASLS